ncbi:MAG: EamA family transporter [Aureispira sp.]|nr:EamA family transporter [Aureispira sp.]
MSATSNNHYNYAQLHLAVLLFGCVGLFGKWIILPAYLIVFGRTFFASMAIGSIILYKKESITIGRSGFKFLLLGFILAFHWVAFFQSVQLSTVAIGLLTFSTFPIFTTFLTPLFFKAKLDPRSTFSSFIIFIGVACIVMDGQLSDSYLWGIVWGIASGASFAVLTLLNKQLVGKHSSRVIALMQNGFAALFLLPLALLFWVPIDGQTLLLLIILGIIFTGLAHTLFIESMQTISAQTASLVACLEPVYGVIGALIFLKEYPTFWVWIGGLIIITVIFWDAQRN